MKYRYQGKEIRIEELPKRTQLLLTLRTEHILEKRNMYPTDYIKKVEKLNSYLYSLLSNQNGFYEPIGLFD